MIKSGNLVFYYFFRSMFKPSSGRQGWWGRCAGRSSGFDWNLWGCWHWAARRKLLRASPFRSTKYCQWYWCRLCRTSLRRNARNIAACALCLRLSKCQIEAWLHSVQSNHPMSAMRLQVQADFHVLHLPRSKPWRAVSVKLTLMSQAV